MNKLSNILKKITTDLEVKGHTDINITGISANSKNIGYGDIFIAKKGLTNDGSNYINEASSAGASAVVTDIYDPFVNITQLITSNINALEAELAYEFYHNAASELNMIAITGTNGKTSCSYMLKHILEENKIPTGMIGSIEYQVGSHTLPANMTTPDVITNHKLLNMMRENKCLTAIMEVSSHALEQGRTKKIDFNIAVYTNLSQDHLDYHHDMNSYAKAKASLFHSMDKNSQVIINNDDLYAHIMTKDCHAHIITYGLSADADFYAKNITYSNNGTKFDIVTKNITKTMSWSMLGKHNVYNALAVIASAEQLKLPINDIIKSLKSFEGAPGRLERLTINDSYDVFVDSAATEDALENTFQALSHHQRKRTITVFGCGGNRDKDKRPKMAAVCEKYSDLCIVTNDNPRNEDPSDIIRDILQGFQTEKYIVIEDRHNAIEKALEIAEPKDLILIAGRGHETEQIFDHMTVEFDDRQIALEIHAKQMDYKL